MNIIHSINAINDFSFSLGEFTYTSIIIRLLLAAVMSGLIGIERGSRKRAAGFRTYVLVSVSSALVMMTNEYIHLFLFTNTDPTRLGAQVITGIGFLGAGTILVSRHNRVSGLTTAAGLWASACIGLAIGIGFIFGAFIAWIIIFASIAILPKFERHIYTRSHVVNFYVELYDLSAISTVLNSIKSTGSIIIDSYISDSKPIKADGVVLDIIIQLDKYITAEEIESLISINQDVYYIEEY